jgi:hypothetical protein
VYQILKRPSTGSNHTPSLNGIAVGRAGRPVSAAATSRLSHSVAGASTGLPSMYDAE